MSENGDGWIEQIRSAIATKRKKKKPATRAVKKVKRYLAPGIEIPSEFLVAQEKIITQLFGKAPATRKPVKGATNQHVVSVGIGQKVTRGKPTGALCIVVTVTKKLPMSKVNAKYRIPKSIKVGKVSVPVDIKIGKHARPLASVVGGDACGITIPEGLNKGSIGCFCFMQNVKDPDTGKVGRVNLLLTNSHVIGGFVTGNDTDHSSDKVLDGDSQQIGHGVFMVPSSNGIDAAMSNVTDDTPEGNMHSHTDGLKFSDKIISPSDLSVGTTVQIAGALSGSQSGKVKRVDGVHQVPYEFNPAKGEFYRLNKTVTLRDILVIHPSISQGGDSGSLVVANGRPTALLIAGGIDEDGESITLAQDLTTIQNELLFDGIFSVP